MRSFRVAVRIGIAVIAVALVAISVSFAIRSRFVAERRAAFELHRAEGHLASRDFERARRELRTALRLQPDHLEARRRLAAMELEQGNTEVAFLEYRSLTELHPRDPGAFIALAGLMMKSGLLEAPESLLDKAIDAAPRSAEARRLRGEIRFRLGRYQGALQDARAAVAAAPADADSQALLRRCLARSEGAEPDPAHAPAPPRRLRPDAQIGGGHLGAFTREHWPGRMARLRQTFEAQVQGRSWTEAQGTIDTARREFPETVFPPYLAGLLALARGNLDEAERWLNEALSVAPRLPVVIGALGRVWSLRNGTAFAGDQLMRLAARDPQLSIVRYMAARAFIEARDPIRAEAALRRGLELQPDSSISHQHLTDYYFGLDRGPEALDICRQGLERFPDDVDLTMMLAQMEASLGRTADAIAVYERLTSSRPDIDLAQYKLGMLLAAQTGEAEKRQFLAVVRRLQADRPSDPFLLDALGWMQHRAGDGKRARELLELAAKAAPDEPGVLFHLAVVHAGQKEAALARQELQAAVDSPRPFAERIEALRLLRDNGGAPLTPARKRAEAGGR